jgi:hypothetical protein
MMDSSEREDYHDIDHLAQLARSHSMTMAMLEQGAFEKDSDIEQKSTVKYQIVPTKEDILRREGKEVRVCAALSHSHAPVKELNTRREGEAILHEFRRHSLNALEYKLPTLIKRYSQEYPESEDYCGQLERDYSPKSSDESSPENKLSKSDNSLQRSSPGSKFCRTALMLWAAAALTTATVFWSLPTTRSALDRALGEMIKETGQRLALNSHVAPMFSMLILEETQLPDYDQLLSPLSTKLTATLPLFWMIPHTGSHTARDVLSYCMKLVISDERGALHHDSKVRDS